MNLRIVERSGILVLTEQVINGQLAMETEFTSYAFQDVPLKKIRKYAVQYEGVNMANLIGADEENFPFLVRAEDECHMVMFWNKCNGPMIHLDEDCVRQYATVQYLLEHAYPVFDSLHAANEYAMSRDWPRITTSG